MDEKRSALRRLPLVIAATAAAVCGSAPALADEGFAIQKHNPSFAGDWLFGVTAPYSPGDGTAHAMVVIDYAHDPLVARDAKGTSVGAVVSDQIILHANASVSVWDRVTINVDLPVAFTRGEKPVLGGMTFDAPSPAALGDLRFGLRATLFGEATDAFQLGLAALLWLPTGSRSAFTGDGLPRSMPMVIAGGATRYFVWSANVGPELRAARPFVTATPGAALRYGAGLGFLIGEGRRLQIGPEVTGGFVFADVSKRAIDLEALAGAKLRFAERFVAGTAVGVGLTPGVGTPDFRALLSLAYSPPTALPQPVILDRDGDAIPDAEDACPDEAGARDADPQKNGCPKVNDRDGDGIPDAEDACPDVAGVRDPIPKLNGCPTDRDNDGIPDREDACPEQIGERDADPKKNGCPHVQDRDGDQIPDDKDACPDVAGVPSQDPKRHGCPLNMDRDGDGIVDEKDACPEEKGPADPDPQKNGCPKDVRVTEGEIVILQQVEFDTGKATIRPVSNPLLDTVAGVLREHPEIMLVEVQGHTDNRGAAEVNTALSQARADAVMAALIKRGIAAHRLVAKGYGPTKPVFSNITTIGRQKNRRVEFHILDKRKK
jgi:outer membrane protein OmpA-like peptidoglycan-associated protein